VGIQGKEDRDGVESANWVILAAALAVTGHPHLATMVTPPEIQTAIMTFQLVGGITRMLTSLAVNAGRQGARRVLAGATRELANAEALELSGGRLARTTSPGMAVTTGRVLQVEHLGRRTIIMGEDMTEIRSAMAQSQPEAGFYDVVIHGDSTSFGIHVKVNGKIDWRPVSVRELANIIRPQLKPGDKIRLLACEVGNTGGPAQQLANELEREVWASTTKVPAVPKATPGVIRRSFVPKAGGKFNQFIPERGAGTLAGGGQVTGNELQGVIRAK
jgi:hypothetical protein